MYEYVKRRGDYYQCTQWRKLGRTRTVVIRDDAHPPSCGTKRQIPQMNGMVRIVCQPISNAQSRMYSCNEIWVVKWHLKTVSLVYWPLPINRTVNILVLRGVEIEHMHIFDETWVSLCHRGTRKWNLVRKQQILIQKTLEVLSLLRSILHWYIHNSKNYLVSSSPLLGRWCNRSHSMWHT